MQIITEDDGSRWLSLDTPIETSSDLYRLLEAALREKGSSDAWLAYALPDIHTAVQQFMQAEWQRGYQACATGIGAGALNPPRVGSEPSLQDLADEDQCAYEDLREAFTAGYKAGNELDRGADFADLAFGEWTGTQIVEASEFYADALMGDASIFDPHAGDR